MLTRPDSPHYNDIVADATLAVVRATGVSGLTLKRLGQWIGVTPQALLNRYGSRDRLLAVALRTIVDRWCFDQAYRWRLQIAGAPKSADSLLALLPEPDDLAELPAWLALLAMAVATPEHQHLAARVRDEERTMVAASLRSRQHDPGPSDPDDTALVIATLDGLRTALADPMVTLDLVQARGALTRLVDAIGAAPVPEAA